MKRRCLLGFPLAIVVVLCANGAFAGPISAPASVLGHAVLPHAKAAPHSSVSIRHVHPVPHAGPGRSTQVAPMTRAAPAEVRGVPRIGLANASVAAVMPERRPAGSSFHLYRVGGHGRFEPGPMAAPRLGGEAFDRSVAESSTRSVVILVGSRQARAGGAPASVRIAASAFRPTDRWSDRRRDR